MPGRAGKGGTESPFSACSDDGVAIAAKVEDRSFRTILPAVELFFGGLAIDVGDPGIANVENSRSECVGVVRVRPKSRVPKSRARV
jgi:hypothetical protein